MKTFKHTRKCNTSDAVILHLDGDRKYSRKAFNFYNDLNLNAIVQNIPENRQDLIILDLLNKYKPNILVATGHDSMYRKGQGFYNMNNYKNSRYFVNTVRKARKWNKSEEDFIIFAGACESFYEAIMSEGANFASSPGRILIDYLDPLIVASRVALTDKNKFITIHDIVPFLKDGIIGVGGTKAKGKR